MPRSSRIRRYARPLANLIALIGEKVGRHEPDSELTVVLPDEGGPTIGAVHFGGPDRAAGGLRDLLLARVRATPPGAAIDWATYYFLDGELADALIAAAARGVRVRLVVEGAPRFGAANGAVLARLAEDGLGGGLTIRAPAPAPLGRLSGKLHLKIYAFSWPAPHALVGSFNPSGGAEADAATIREIGDQDRGHNLLVEIVAPALVARLVDQVRGLGAHGGAMPRDDAGQNRVWQAGDTALFFYPRRRARLIEAEVDRLGAGDRLHAAVSHLKNAMAARLAAAAARGARLHLIVHDTERRVPRAAVERLAAAGARVRRFHDPQRLPMHAKFILTERAGGRAAWFGSLNLNRNSRLLNDELLVRSTDAALFATLLDRFMVIDRMIDAQAAADPAGPGAGRVQPVNGG